MNALQTETAPSLDVAVIEKPQQPCWHETAPVAGSGKCTVGGCGCPSFVDPPGGFNCSRCGHAKSDHW